MAQWPSILLLLLTSQLALRGGTTAFSPLLRDPLPPPLRLRTATADASTSSCISPQSSPRTVLVRATSSVSPSGDGSDGNGDAGSSGRDSTDGADSAVPATPQERLLSWAASQQQRQQQQPPSSPSSPPNNAGPPTTTYLSPSLRAKVRPPSRGGAGLFASRPLRSGETIAALPLSAFRFDADAALEALRLTDDGGAGDGDAGDSPVRERIAELVEDGTAGSRLAALAGAIAHLHLLRLRRSREGGGDGADGIESRSSGNDGIDSSSVVVDRIEARYGPFLDVLPLLPSLPSPPSEEGDGDDDDDRDRHHPFPTHVLNWSDDEIASLLPGTAAQTQARWIRAAAGEAVGLLGRAFVAEHCPRGGAVGGEVADARDAIVSAFACAKSRSFEAPPPRRPADGGGGGGGARGGSGKMMLPVLDLLNHAPASSYRRNVLRTIDGGGGRWRGGEGEDEDEGGEGEGEGGEEDDYRAVLTAARDIKAGEELLTDYGHRPSWDWGVEYGFVPDEVGASGGGEEDDGTTAGGAGKAVVLPLFPTQLVREDGTVLDLTSRGRGDEGRLAVRTVGEALGAAGCGTPLEVLELFVVRQTSDEAEAEAEGGGGAFPPRRPCAVIGVDGDGGEGIAEALRSRALPAFRAASCVLESLREGRTAELEEVERAVAGNGGGNSDDCHDCDDCDEYDGVAVALMLEGARERVDMLVVGGAAAEAWAASDGGGRVHGPERLELARRMREAELAVLREAEWPSRMEASLERG